MALESIGATNSGMNYVDVVKQNVNKAPQTQVKAAEEVAKKAATPAATASALTTTVSAEAKGAEASAQKKEEHTEVRMPRAAE